MVIDGLDIFYPPYPSQLVVDVYQNVKHVFGVCIFVHILISSCIQSTLAEVFTF